MKIKSIEKFYSAEKEWVRVVFDNNEVWVPAFDDLGKITYLIGQCEDMKYPNGKGLELTKEFFEEAILTGITYEEFCEEKKIPLTLK